MKVSKLGHVEFEVESLSRMVEHYTEVIGLTIIERDAKTAYLANALDHHSVVLRQGEGAARLTKIAFQIAPGDQRDVIKHLQGHGLDAEVRTGSQPGIDSLVRTTDPDGTAIELYSETRLVDVRRSRRGVDPVKLSHVATLCPDVKRTAAYYMDVLGFRFSDSTGDFFYFLRCGCDHHTVNLLAGRYAALQHVAFELNDSAHIAAGCDVLGHHGVPTLWGPLRHGAGHNLAVYHLDPEGQIVEFCAELDRMSSEDLGYFDPRPWHADKPQRPKRWDDPKAAAVVWGQFPPPERFNKGAAQPA